MTMTWQEWDGRFRRQLDVVTTTTDNLRRVIEHRLSTEVEIIDAIDEYMTATAALAGFLSEDPPRPRRSFDDMRA